MNIGSASKKLADYIREVEVQTGRSVEISPYNGATVTDSPRASLEIGPMIDFIDIRFRPLAKLREPNIEKLVAHELTHALMVYVEGYHMPAAPPHVSQYDVQTVAEIVDLVDDVIVDVRIHELGFNLPSQADLDQFREMVSILEIATSRSQIDPFEDDPMRAEIKLVSDFVYAWVFPRYASIAEEESAIYSRFVERFPVVMEPEFPKARRIVDSMIANDIFTADGRTAVVVDAIDLWPVNFDVYLTSFASA